MKFETINLRFEDVCLPKVGNFEPAEERCVDLRYFILNQRIRVEPSGRIPFISL